MFAPPPTTPPPPVAVQQKRGMGCFGIGCVVLVIALILIGGFVAIMSYLTAGKINSLTSSTPVTTQSHDAGDDVYDGAEQKLTNFQAAQQQSRPASIELTSDEINTLIARDADFSKNHVNAFVTMTGNRMKIEATLPADLIPMPFGLLKGQYINGAADFSPSFNPGTRDLTFKLYGLKIGNQEMPAAQLSTIQTQVNPFINSQMHLVPNTQGMLDHVQAIEVRDGKLEIQTK